MSIASFFPGVSLWITLLVFFLLNFYLAWSRAKVIDRIGKILAPLLIAFACLTTSVSITSMAGDMLQEVTGGKVKYKLTTALVFSVGDFLSGLGFPENFASRLVGQLPLGRQSFGWLIPTAVVMIVAYGVTVLNRGSRPRTTPAA